MTVTTYKEREQEQYVLPVEVEPILLLKPIDRLRQLLRDAQTDHLEFTTPHGKRLLVCTDRFFETRPPAFPPLQDLEVVVALGSPGNKLIHPDYKFEECFWFQREWVQIQASQVRVVLDSQFLGHIETNCGEDLFVDNETRNWCGEKYDGLANGVINLIQQSTPIPQPAQ
ncbi:MAG: hypothetical protein HYU80_00170 [Candidatus Blackburnbacteria bacterium]|nr:hypothetical protein [Candidatus Blackburnbacteria bacterium]